MNKQTKKFLITAGIGAIAMGLTACGPLDTPSPGARAYGGIEPTTSTQESLASRVPPDEMDSPGFDVVVADPLLEGTTSTDVPLGMGRFVSIWVDCDRATSHLRVRVTAANGAKLLDDTQACDFNGAAFVSNATEGSPTEQAKVLVEAPGSVVYRIFVGAEGSRNS
ncbi:hypothetical protein ACTXPA_15415 [Glutamicibacter arilaitensis]|uniref:hypothetical protein n=1 Tax=Glutamicibacter arilaitensis TaxID=256701 RepID=UPI003FCF9851